MSTHAPTPESPNTARVLAQVASAPADADASLRDTDTTEPRAAKLPNRRSTEPIDVLSRRLNGACTHAVSPLELAATIEAQGINDAICREKYGCDDVFALARELYTRVPLRIVAGEARQRTVQRTGTSLARGALFALPGLFFLLVTPLFRSDVGAVAILTAVTVGWGLSQVLSILGYTLTGRGASSSAGKILGLALIAGLATMAAGAAAVFALGWSSNLTAVCCTQILYVMSATVLLLFRRDTWLWVCLLPGVLMSAAYLAGNPFAVPREVAIGGVVVAMATTFTAALVAADQEYQAGTRGGAGVERSDLYVASQYGVYGMLVAVCLAAPMMRAALDPNSHAGMIGIAALPLVLSMGVAEWQQIRYAELRHRAKSAEYGLETFAGTARRGLASSAGIHVAALFGLTVAAAAGLYLVGSLTTATSIMLVAYFLFGSALFASVLLLGWGQIAGVMPVFILSAVAMWALLFGVPGATRELVAYAIATAALAVTLYLLVFRAVNNLTNHDG